MNKIQNAYTTTAAEISAQVSQLQVYADKLHDVSPDDLSWGQVAELGRMQAILTEAVNLALKIDS